MHELRYMFVTVVWPVADFGCTRAPVVCELIECGQVQEDATRGSVAQKIRVLDPIAMRSPLVTFKIFDIVTLLSFNPCRSAVGSIGRTHHL
jgi:hypothetical protein